MNLPVQAKVARWEPADGIGQLKTAAGDIVKFGRSACTDFEPSVGILCWLIEAKPDPRGDMRAKVVNQSGVAEQDPATAALEKAQKAKAAALTAKTEAKARWLTQSRMLPSGFYDAIRKQTGFEVPELFQRMFVDGALSYVDENGESRSLQQVLHLDALPLLLCCYEVRWLQPHDIVDELEPARERPLDRSILRAQRGVSMDDVQRSWTREVPFVYTGRGWYCWNTEWVHDGQTAIAFCEKTGELRGYAPHLEGFLFRQMIEGLTYQLNHWGGLDWDLDHLVRVLGRCVQRLEPFVRRDWVDVLTQTLRRTPTEQKNANGTLYWSFLSLEEANAEISSRLGFPQLNVIDEY